MNDIKMNISFPLDSDNFFRRQCSLCKREFKILLEEKELEDFTKKGIDSFLLEQSEEKDVEEDELEKFYCPYCGQSSSYEKWWTKEQSAYLKIYIENVMKEMINKNFIDSLKRSLNHHDSDPFSIKFEGKEMKLEEPWISPEENDMEIFRLPCCKRKLKIIEGWKNKVHCFFCGFPHENK